MSDEEIVRQAAAAAAWTLETLRRSGLFHPAASRQGRGCSAARRRPLVDSPEKAALRLGHLRSLRKEHVLALHLDVRNREILQDTVSIGTLTASLIHPREVFGPAISSTAAGVLLAHNHPSGDPSPSREDREVTSRLARAGEILGIPLLDHLIVSESGHFSFREHGLL